MTGGVVDVLLHLRALRVIGHVGNQIQRHARQGLHKCLVDGRGHGGSTLVGDMRSDRIDFLIEIVFEPGVLDLR